MLPASGFFHAARTRRGSLGARGRGAPSHEAQQQQGQRRAGQARRRERGRKDRGGALHQGAHERRAEAGQMAVPAKAGDAGVSGTMVNPTAGMMERASPPSSMKGIIWSTVYT